MNKATLKKVFGPVPSRRLGKSIGINNIPPKICSYTCVYCQLGMTHKMIAHREEFYRPEDLLYEIEEKIVNAIQNKEDIDYLTIVPDGEPTLDKNLGKLIDLIKPLGYKTAVITNSTLLHDPDVREDLAKADWVSVKIDSLDENIWKKIDIPHKNINFKSMLKGIETFSQMYRGKLVTETMLVKDLNCEVENTARFIKSINPSVSYISIPTRPPAVSWVKPPDEEHINKAFQVFTNHSINTEYLIGYEGNQFAYTGNVAEDILSITSVHPMREDAVLELLQKSGSDFSIVEEMLKKNELVMNEYNKQIFYLRKLTSH